jgi:mRNA interferase RelE/StbE
MHELYYTAEAKAQIQKLDAKIQAQLKSATLRIARNPTGTGKILTHELTGYWSYRSGDYRVIYQIYHKEIRILVVTIAHRKSVYDHLTGKFAG